MIPRRFLGLLLAGVWGSSGTASGQALPRLVSTDLGTVVSWDARFRLEVVAESLSIPVAMAFLPDGRALVAERAKGRLDLLDFTRRTLLPVEGLPAIHLGGDAGLLDILPHPDFSRNGLLYLAYSVDGPGGSTTAVDRARLNDNRLTDRQRIFTALPFVEGNEHYGGRLVLRDGFLFITVGERDQRIFAQDLGVHLGKILRLHEDGRVPSDNPLAGRQGARPEIWSYGHRNPQGLTLHPETGALWENEHGPRGGDEINLPQPGRNYGWPVITYGREYEGGPVGEGLTTHEGMERPLYYYTPSIAPSGMEFYTGDAFPAWRGISSSARWRCGISTD